MAKGGRRPGAGRPRGRKNDATLKRETQRAYFDEQARCEFAPILEQYFRRAKGLESAADPRILIDVLNRLLGKPPEAVELSGPGGAVPVRLVMEQLKE